MSTPREQNLIFLTTWRFRDDLKHLDGTGSPFLVCERGLIRTIIHTFLPPFGLSYYPIRSPAHAVYGHIRHPQSPKAGHHHGGRRPQQRHDSSRL